MTKQPQRSRSQEESGLTPPQPSAERAAGSKARGDLAELLEALEQRGLPSGAWLIDIARTRQALQEADNLLRRLEEAIVRSASSSPLERP